MEPVLKESKAHFAVVSFLKRPMIDPSCCRGAWGSDLVTELCSGHLQGVSQGLEVGGSCRNFGWKETGPLPLKLAILGVMPPRRLAESRGFGTDALSGSQGNCGDFLGCGFIRYPQFFKTVLRAGCVGTE